jgi:type I restriction enzyme M protein
VQPPTGKKNFSKTNPIRNESFSECISLWAQRLETENSWTVPVQKVKDENFNLDFKNPHKLESIEHVSPEILMEGIVRMEKEIFELMHQIKQSLVVNMEDE